MLRGHWEAGRQIPLPPSDTRAHSHPPLSLFIIPSKKNKKINKINNPINREATL